MASPTPSSLDLPPDAILTVEKVFASAAADRLTEFGDLQSIIVRRFDKLALQNILYLHARLASIDNTAEFPPGTLWHVPPSPPAGETQLLLANYHDAILRYSEVLKLSRPPAGYVHDLIKALLRPESDEGISNPDIISSQFLKKNRPAADLVALSPFSDPLTRFISSTPLGFFCLDILASARQGKAIISLPRIRGFVAIFQALISIGFLVGAMWALYKLTDMVTRLAIVSGFVGGFCFWLAVTTDIKKRDVFAATAAYAAVLVVYVGSTGESPVATCSCPPGAV